MHSLVKICKKYSEKIVNLTELQNIIINKGQTECMFIVYPVLMLIIGDHALKQ